MLLTEIDNCGPTAAESLSNAGYSLAEEVAYAPLHEVSSVENVNYSLVESAQLLVTQVSGLSAEQALDNRNFWCNQCGMHDGLAGSFNSARVCETHHENCDECDPEYDF